MRSSRARPAHRRQDRRPRRHPRRLRDRSRQPSDARDPARIEAVSGAQGIVSPSCRTASGPRRSSSGSRRWCRPRSSRASRRSTTTPTATTALRLVIEVKSGFHPEALLEQLFKLTPMEDSFGINAVALVDGQPRTLGLLRCSRSSSGTGATWCAAHDATGWRRARPAAPRRGACWSPSSTSTRSSRSSAAATTPPRPARRLTQRLRPVGGPGQPHPGPAAAPAHQVLPAGAGEGAVRAAADHRGAGGDPGRRRPARPHRGRRARGGGQPVRDSAPHGAAGVGRGNRVGVTAAGDRRRPPVWSCSARAACSLGRRPRPTGRLGRPQPP
jgi:hypothetical protein